MFYVKRPIELKKSILENQTIFFYSPKGTGKTEFIKNELFIENNMIYIDLSNTFTLKDLAYAIIEETAYFFNKDIGKIDIKTNDTNLFKTALLYPIFESEDKRFNELVICFDNFNYILNFHLKNEDEIFRIVADILQKSDVKMIFSLNNIDGEDIFLNPQSSLYGFANKLEFIEIERDEILKNANDFLSTHKITLNLKNINFLLNHFGFNMRYIKLFISELVAYKNSSFLLETDEEVMKKCLNVVYNNVKYEIKNELFFLVGKKSWSDILYYIAKDSNVYVQIKENLNMSKQNTYTTLNNLLKSGLIIQEKNYKKYLCRDNILKRYVLENFKKGDIK